MEQRKLMLPAFHGEKMERLGGLMAEVAEREVDELAGAAEASRSSPRMQRLTLEIILRAVFGLDPGPRLDAIRERLSDLLAFGDRPISLAPPAPDGLRPNPRALRPVRRVRRDSSEETDALLFELIDERRGRERASATTCSRCCSRRVTRTARRCPHQELRDELMTLLVAGHETTASDARLGVRAPGPRAARARAPRRRDRRRRRRRLPHRHDPGDAAPPARCCPTSTPRLVKAPFEVGGWKYPPGVCLVPNAYLVHHDPEIYPDPYAFRPERFLDEPPGTYTWIPFGGGRRRCLGASFAMLEMKIVLRAVLTRRELRPAERRRRARLGGATSPSVRARARSPRSVTASRRP